MKSYLRLLILLKPYRKALLWAFLASLLYALFNAIAIWFSASFLTTIFTAGDSTRLSSLPSQAASLNESLKSLAWQLIGHGDRFVVVQRVGVIFFLAFLLRNFFDIGQVWFIYYVEQRVIKDVRDLLYNHLLIQQLNFFFKRKAGELSSVILNDVTQLNNHMMRVVTVVMRDPFIILLFLVLLFSISVKLTLAAMILLPVAGILIDQLGKSLKRKSSRMLEALAGVTNLLTERLGGIRLIKVLGTEKPETERFEKSTYQHFRLALRQRRFDTLNVPSTELLGMAIISLILIYGGFLVFRAQTMDPEDFVRFIAILFSLLTPAKLLGSAYISLQVSAASAERMYKILDTHEELPQVAQPRSISGLQQGIIFDQVNFQYESGNADALTGINLNIQRGETVALVGPSGAGKTTLIGLMMRLFDPQQGRILLDGVDLRELKVEDLRRLFGVVSQDIVLFNDTVANNISYGHSGLNRDRIEEAARLAYADEFIHALPQGYDTSIGDRGLRLSGGQQQRLSIARALVGDPPVIIFDEATSQLDSESEALIQKALETLSQKHTVIVIAHRLATVRKADRIIVLEGGRVIDQGTYSELLKRCELFNRLCQQQFLTV